MLLKILVMAWFIYLIMSVVIDAARLLLNLFN